MQLRFFQVPAYDDGDAGEEVNKFLRSHKVITVDRHFIADGINSHWAICVSYVDGTNRSTSAKRSKVDYREVLSEADFVLYSKLRDLRKRLATQEGCPVYAIFTNEQLAMIAEQRPSSIEALVSIDGVGEAKVEKHGEAFLPLLEEAAPKTAVDPRPAVGPRPNGEVHGA